MIFFAYMLPFCKRMSICFANSVEEPFEPPHDKTNYMAVRLLCMRGLLEGGFSRITML